MIRLGESVSYVRPIELILKVYYMYI